MMSIAMLCLLFLLPVLLDAQILQQSLSSVTCVPAGSRSCSTVGGVGCS